MNTPSHKTKDIEKLVEEIDKWLIEYAPYTAHEKKHNVIHTPERAYWHYGYRTALKDVLKLLRS